MEELQKLGHWGDYSGVISEVREKLRDRGEDLTIAAVSHRIKMGRHSETMRLYGAAMRRRKAEIARRDAENDKIKREAQA